MRFPMLRLTIAVLNMALAVCSLCSGQDFTEMQALCAPEKPCFDSMRALASGDAVAVASISTDPVDFGPLRALADGICTCTEDGVCTCGKDCTCTKKKPDRSDDVADLIRALQDEIKSLKSQLQKPTSAHLSPEAEQKRKERVSKPDLSSLASPAYPVRDSRTWWTHPGDRTKPNIINHLMSGQHAGKWTRSQLEAMSLAELESLHSDDHEHRVKRQLPKPSEDRGEIAEAKPAADRNRIASVDYNGREALYELKVTEKKVWGCNGNSCGWNTVRSVTPVFKGWAQ